jgi:hypothetical protein
LLSENVFLYQGANVTDFQYCEDRSINMLQMARLGRRLSTAGKVSIVYTYSPAAAGAMKLLSNLILGGKVEGATRLSFVMIVEAALCDH